MFEPLCQPFCPPGDGLIHHQGDFRIQLIDLILQPGWFQPEISIQNLPHFHTSNAWNPFLCMWVPNMIVGAVGIVFFALLVKK